MKRQGKFTGLMLSALLALGIFAIPAQASTPHAAVCTGTATVSPGLTFPGVGPSHIFDWRITTNACTPGASITASGSGSGWCGQSSSSGGQATANFGGGDSHSFSNVGWTVNAGGGFIVTGDGSNGETLAAEVYATGGADCAAEGGATSFEVVIVAEIA